MTIDLFMFRQNAFSDVHTNKIVKRPFLFIALLSFCLLSTACGGFYAIGFISSPGGGSTISGTVSMVNLGFIQDVTGVQIQFTGVTFVNPGTTATTINFCGDQHSKFRINSSVQATFTSGIFCATVTSVVVNTEPTGRHF